jgi:hypothetical protein
MFAGFPNRLEPLFRFLEVDTVFRPLKKISVTRVVQGQYDLKDFKKSDCKSTLACAGATIDESVFVTDKSVIFQITTKIQPVPKYTQHF